MRSHQAANNCATQERPEELIFIATGINATVVRSEILGSVLRYHCASETHDTIIVDSLNRSGTGQAHAGERVHIFLCYGRLHVFPSII